MNRHITIKELPVSERPYEKCETYGVSMLSDAELLAVIIKTGTKKKRSTEIAVELLSLSDYHKGLLGLCHITLEELMKIDGIGKVKAIQLLCVAELAKRINQSVKEDKIRMISPEVVADYYMEQLRHLEKEVFLLVMLDAKGKLIKDEILSQGNISCAIAEPRDVFVCAIKYNTVGIILVHNHPSGDPTPSRNDLAVTKRIKEAGVLIGITLMDHIIIGDKRYISLKERGLLS